MERHQDVKIARLTIYLKPPHSLPRAAFRLESSSVLLKALSLHIDVSVYGTVSKQPYSATWAACHCLPEILMLDMDRMNLAKSEHS